MVYREDDADAYVRRFAHHSGVISYDIASFLTEENSPVLCNNTLPCSMCGRVFPSFKNLFLKILLEKRRKIF